MNVRAVQRYKQELGLPTRSCWLENLAILCVETDARGVDVALMA